METPTAPSNLKCAPLIGGAVACGWVIGILVNRFFTYIAEDSGLDAAIVVLIILLWGCYYVFGVLMMIRVWKGIASYGIQTERMMLPGIVACSTVGSMLFVGLVLSGLGNITKN